MELGQFGIGFVGNGYTDLRFYPDGIGATSWSLGGELFFPFTILAIVPNRRMGDPCKFKIVSRVNNRELVLSPYDRPKVLEFLKEHGVAMQE
ncbi:hypothetical protein DES53_10878 [Roseimicrobium gellanilyticum]|uniref:Uncharacterized protein n=2 Tax=Roseimicrobium gellanilyticum TaxID=748857 RepID=A0A366HD39_9BACT|nr:hypothetical protein DES53_10878 [Roseimicrobium gellanilyticum]